MTWFLAAAPMIPQQAADATTMDWVLLWAYLLLALGVSFLCSLLEASLLSITPSYISLLVQRGRKAGRVLQRMRDNVDQPLSAILTLNTVAHTVGAAGAGAQVAAIFGRQWLGLASAVLTLLILLLSEIVPKTAGAVWHRPLAGFTAYTTRGMVIGLWPLVQLCMLISRWVRGPGGEHQLTREEMTSLPKLGREAGALRHDESRLMQNLMRLREIRVNDIMTPRSVVYMLEETKTVGEVMSDSHLPRFARVPIYRENPDRLIGFVARYHLVQCYHRGRMNTTMAMLAQPLSAIPAQAKVGDALEQFINEQRQIYQVVDEYGGTAGILTFEDAIESLLGAEIVDETDPVADMQALARERRARRLADDTEPGQPGD